jgi:hypothetical protein
MWVGVGYGGQGVMAVVRGWKRGEASRVGAVEGNQNFHDGLGRYLDAVMGI